MRRPVEEQVEIAKFKTDSLGILILVILWTLALMALSTAARAEDAQKQQDSKSASAARKDVVPDNGDIHAGTAAGNSEATAANPKTSTKDAGQAPAKGQADADEQVLTRFILISIPDRQLALVDDSKVVKVYPIAVGAKHSPSPIGNFTVISHVTNPTWSHKGKVVAPGKDNPVGSRWMGLSLKGYGIHGTNAPQSIGKAASHGCFRMGKNDIEELFALVRVGDTVAVRSERDELVNQVFGNAAQAAETQVAALEADDDGATE